ncbi:MAG: fluoride efflux transporter CrcB [Proteobacteria bacterium]|nr:fluoride efflux transporter CrcB [Pseudomonadota bacterium]
MPLQLYLAVALGGALGSVGRYFVSGLVATGFGETFPWGTLIVNVTGSFVIGFFGVLTGPDGRFLVSGTVRQFVMVGICGGYTTFSSFSLQTLNLMRDGEWLYVGWNVAGSVILCLFFVWLGAISAAALNQLKGA